MPEAQDLKQTLDDLQARIVALRDSL